MQEDDDFETPCPVSASIRRAPKTNTNTKPKPNRKCKNSFLPQSDAERTSSQPAKRSKPSQLIKENVPPLHCKDESNSAFNRTFGSQSLGIPTDPNPLHSHSIGSRLLSQPAKRSESFEPCKENVAPLDCKDEPGLAFRRTLGCQTLCMPTIPNLPHSCSTESGLLSLSKQQRVLRYEVADEAERPSSPLANGSKCSQDGNSNAPPLDSKDEPSFAVHRAVGCRHFDARTDPNPTESQVSSLTKEQQLLRNEVADKAEVDFESNSQLDILIRLCSDANENDVPTCSLAVVLECPVCGLDISELNEESRQLHTNACLDKCDRPKVSSERHITPHKTDSIAASVESTSRIAEWLRSLGLDKYEEAFTREEIDWDTLRWMTEEDLIRIGVTALGPRKKIVQALNELIKEGTRSISTESETHDSTVILEKTKKLAASRLITDYFSGPGVDKKKSVTCSRGQEVIGKDPLPPDKSRISGKRHAPSRKPKDVPLWCIIPGTPFRVDAFCYLRRDCTHWFLTHFHTDHYQGLTRSFFHGKIYCSMITAKLVNMKIGIPWDKLVVLPLNQKVNINGVNVTFFDANHCPGAVIMLFEPPNGKAVLHTGDFRFNEEMAILTALAACSVHTLILDTTYCDPQYDFPKQEAIIQFVIEAIQAESFHQKTLFLIGSYTIGKERLFLEVARVLHKKVHVTAAKLRLLECLELPEEDMQWLTTNEGESHIHVVPMWTLASFKRLKQLSHQYTDRFSLIVAFSPTGWSFGKGKKSTGRRWQQGTIIRYEVPYSEHCSFTELKRFVKLLSPTNIIPSVNNHGEESSRAILAKLLS